MGKILSLLIGLILFSAAITWIAAFYGELGINYGVNVEGGGFLNRSVETAGLLEALQNETGEGPRSSDLTSFVIYTPVGILLLTAESVDMVTSISTDAQEKSGLPLPTGFAYIVGSIVATIIIAMAVTVWLKYEV